jgi:DNA replicative helicase MCM subunit Mcm2 (Cdc46/Mcm family)
MRPPFYFEKLKELKELEETILEVDCDHIYQFDKALYRQLEDFPCDIIPLFDLVATAVYREMYMYTQIGMGNPSAIQQPGHNSFGQDPQAQEDEQLQDVMI